MPSVSMVCGPTFSSAPCAAASKASASAPAITTAMPGLVQNWPAPMVSDPAQPSAMPLARADIAAGSRNIGLTLPSSPKNGIGSGRPAQRSNSALPPASEPVKPTARISGCCTSEVPTSRRPPWISEKVPGGMPQLSMAARIASATISPVPGCAEWPLTTTGQPAASAAAVSPPAVEKASGKFEAPNTATGPIGRSTSLMSGRGAGLRSGSAGSWRRSR